VVPGGFGSRGIDGKMEAIRYARENKVPFLGICLGMQLAIVEFARNVLGLSEAHSTEFNSTTPYPVIDLLPEQKEFDDIEGTFRLGNYPCYLQENTKLKAAYGDVDFIEERHRNRFEFNNKYRDHFSEKGLIFSSLSKDKSLVEAIKIIYQSLLVASHFHPVSKSRPTTNQSIIIALIAPSVNKGKERFI